MDGSGVGMALGSGSMGLISYHHLPNQGNGAFLTANFDLQ
jgi:hypothetical protein